MKGFLTTIVALMFMGVALPAASQARRSEEFKDKYKLKEAVVLSRHNIRSPLSDSKSDLGRMTLMSGRNGVPARASLPRVAVRWKR